MHTPGSLPDDHPVVRQFDAYNAHRLDDFVQCFAATIRLTRSDGSVRAEGHHQLRAVYEPVFAIPGRRATILNRIVVGHRVVDHERVDDDGGNSFEAIVSYRMADGEIVEMTVLD